MGSVFSKVAEGTITQAGAITLPVNLSNYDIVIVSLRFQAGSNMNTFLGFGSIPFFQALGNTSGVICNTITFSKNTNGLYSSTYLEMGSIFFGNTIEYTIGDSINVGAFNNTSNIFYTIYVLS